MNILRPLGMIKALGLTAGITTMAMSTASFAVPFVIDPGFDLIHTNFAEFDFGGPLGPQEFEGVPFPLFDFTPFGGGVADTGNADTIVQRKDQATPSNSTIDIEMVALSLRSVDPIAVFLGGSAGGHLVTDVSDNGGNTMTIGFNGSGDAGIFSSVLSMTIDFIDELTNTILLSVSKTFTATGASWTMTPPPGAAVIPGITSDDFYLSGLALHDAGDGTHTVEHAKVPGPATVLLTGLGLLALYGAARRTN